MRWWVLVLVACSSGAGEELLSTGVVDTSVGDTSNDTGVSLVDVAETFSVERSVDVLFAVDVSCSMADSQAVLADGFSQAFTALVSSGIDYHVGVISTDMDDPTQWGVLSEARGHRWIEPSTPDPDLVFRELALLGTDGSGAELGLSAVYAALGGDAATGSNMGFRRPDAWMQVVVVSDDDDEGDGPPVVTTEEWAWWFDHLTATPEMSAVHSVVDSTRSTPYMELSQMTGGSIADISQVDEADYLALQVVLLPPPTTTFPLAQVPVEGTLVVELSVGGASPFLLAAGLDADYIYDETQQAVVLNTREPAHGDVVSVSYQALP